MSTLQHVTPNRSRKFIFQVLATFLPMALLACGAAYYFYYSTQDRVDTLNRAREAVGIELGQSAISNVLQETRRDLRFVSEHYALKNFLDHPALAEMRDFEQDMLNLSSSSRLYDQIRWLDETGMERVRINFNNGKPVITPALALQNKRARYYFPAAFKLERGEVYMSPLDLNIEHDRIETPHKPMLRIATPVFDSRGDKRGIVLLNYFGAELLVRFDKATADIADHAMLLNQDGYWLKSPRPDEAWGFMFGHDQLTLARRHPAAWQRILAADSGQFEDAEGLWTFSTIYPGLEEQKTPEHNPLSDRASFWKVVAHLPPHSLYGSHPLLKPMLAALAVLLLLQLAGSWKLARVRRLRNEAQDQVLHANLNLERLVEERTEQLQADINLRKQAERRLRLQSSALEAAANAIVITDTEGFIQWANPAYFRLTGFSQKEAIGKRPNDLINSGLQDHVFWEAFWQAIKGGQVWHGEVINKRMDGMLYTEEMTVTPVFDEQGALAHFVAVKEDISERKRLEQRQVAQLRLLEKTTGEMPLATLLEELIQFIEEQAPKLLCSILLADEAQGVLRHGAAPSLSDAYNRLVEGLPIAEGCGSCGTACARRETVIVSDIRSDPLWASYLHLVGDMDWLRACWSTPFFDTAGQLLGTFGVYADEPRTPSPAETELIAYAVALASLVVERKEINEKLWQSESKLATILDSVEAFIYIKDTILHYQYANHQVCELFGKPLEEIVGQGDEAFFDATTAANLHENDRRVLEHGERVETEEVNTSKESGQPRTYLSIKLPLRDEDGGIYALCGVSTDITERKQAEDVLREKEFMLSESQRIAHVGSWQLDLPAGNMTWSDETYRLYGVSPETFTLDLGAFYALIHADDLASMREWVRACLEGERPGELGFRTVLSDGNVRILSGRGDMQYDAENRPIRMFGTVQDITARKRIEEELHQSSEKIQSVFAAATEVAIIATTPEGTITVFNSGAERMLGYTAEEVIGRHTPEIIHLSTEIEARGAELSQEHGRAIHGFDVFVEEARLGRHETREWTYIRKDGTHLTVSLVITAMRDRQGDISGFLGMANDITGRKQAEVKLRTLSTAVEQAPISVVITDLEANIRYVNPRFTKVTGYSADEVVGQNPRILQSNLTPKETYRDMWSTLTGGRVWHGELINIRKNGEIYWEEAHITPVVNAAGATTHYVGVKLDVTERKQAEERLRQAAAVFEATREGIMVTDTEQRILRVNPAFCELTGYTEAEVAGKKPSVLSSGRQGRDFYAAMWVSLTATGHWQGEIWNRRKNGEVYPELLSISATTNDTGQVSGYVGVFADISKLKSSEAELEFLAHHDPLTRLPNRLLLLSRLEHGISLARRENRQMALLMLDLDRFKDINDSFGHLAGDELLQQAAVRLTERLRGVDTVTRLGGDEFTVLLEDIDHTEDAARVANEIIVALSEPWQLANGVEVGIGASVGISLFPQHGNSAAEMLQQADAALYQAKAEGRGRFAYFTENMTRAARERIELEARLRRAIAQNELRVFYQPQVDIATGRIIGAEALVRWQDPVEGLIPPVRFIPVAEATGLINAVGEWVLKETCLQGRRWLEVGLPPLTLAVNVSPHQFLSGNLVEVVSRTLAETGFPADFLELELTESALMDRQQEAVDMLNRLRAIGVRLAIDDFGTGYSSLAYLKRFPLDVLKIDKSFVDDLPDSQDDREIAAAIVAMGHTLRFKVLAEGVETVEQLAFLQGQGCDSYQGYLKSPPLPADAFVKLLAES